MIEWHKTTDVLGKPRWEAQVMTHPNVYLRVTPGPDGVEGLIYAVFRWPQQPHRTPQPCPLDRFIIPPGAGHEEHGKAECARRWEEEHGAKERKVLRRMWSSPVAANFEVVEFRREDKDQRNATLENALVQERMLERKEQRAAIGAEVSEPEKPS